MLTLPRMAGSCVHWYTQEEMTTMKANSPESDAFRSNVLRLMDEREVSLRDIASEIGGDFASLHRLLNGKQDCTISRASRIAKFFGVPLGDLLRPVTAEGKKRRKKTAAA